MTYNQAIEILKNAQNYEMTEILEAEKVIDEMVEKSKAFDRIRSIHIKYDDALGTGDDFVHLFGDIDKAIMGDKL